MNALPRPRIQEVARQLEPLVQQRSGLQREVKALDERIGPLKLQVAHLMDGPRFDYGTIQVQRRVYETCDFKLLWTELMRPTLFNLLVDHPELIRDMLPHPLEHEPEGIPELAEAAICALEELYPLRREWVEVKTIQGIARSAAAMPERGGNPRNAVDRAMATLDQRVRLLQQQQSDVEARNTAVMAYKAAKEAALAAGATHWDRAALEEALKVIKSTGDVAAATPVPTAS